MKINRATIVNKIYIFENSSIHVKRKAKTKALYLKKLFSNKIIAVTNPMIAFAIKNPSAKATKLSNDRNSIYTRYKVIIYIKDSAFKAPIGVPFLKFIDVFFVIKFDFFSLKANISLATPPTKSISVPMHKIKDIKASMSLAYEPKIGSINQTSLKGSISFKGNSPKQTAKDIKA